MSHSPRIRSLSRALVPAVAGLMLVGLWPSQAEAQRRGPRRGRSVTSVIFLGGVTYPRYVYYDRWGPRGYYRSVDYFRYGRYDETVSLRLQVTPRDTEVYVDGYFAGIVDEFDGIFQRLHVGPGGHDITFYLDGHRTRHESIYLNPRSNRTLRFTMETLSPGESASLPPSPADVGLPEVMIDESEPPYPPDARPAPEAAQAFGTLSLRVQPADAEILVDGERWTSPAGQGRIAIELPIGEHRLEVLKDGFARYTETVLILRRRTLTLNVSLIRN